MHRGPLVVQGALLGGALLFIFLLLATSGTNYPTQAMEMEDHTNAQESVQIHADNTDGPTVSSCAVSNQFPQEILRWCELITNYSNMNGLDPNLIAALILQESAGNPVAYSKSGAVGLMQVMPRDGLASSFNCVNGPCFADRPTISQLEDPEFNISFGTKMLSNLLARNGSTREALRSYGPMNVGYYYADIVLGIFERHRG